MLKFALYVATSLALPLFVVYSLFRRRLRVTLAERLGLGAWRNFKKNQDRVIWIHAASLGEVSGVVPVVNKLKELFPKLQIVGTSLSDTGRSALAKHLDTAMILPFDHPWLLRRALSRVKPDLILISETEIWPSFLYVAKRKAVPVLFFNARVSDYTYDSYRRFRFLFKPLLRTVQALYAQTQVDAERFSSLGVKASYLAGSTKCDLFDLNQTDQQKEEIRKSFSINPQDLCFVAGSVHPIEDLAVIRAYKKLRAEFPEIKMIIAPRHNFESTTSALRQEGIDFIRRSEYLNGAQENKAFQVCLLDTIGELSKVYSFATVAYVGGSLVNVGGHNPYEPAAHAVPVIMGPHIVTVRDAVEALQKAGGLFLVKNTNDLYQVLRGFFLKPVTIVQAGNAAKNVLIQSQGATEKVVAGLKPFLLARLG